MENANFLRSSCLCIWDNFINIINLFLILVQQLIPISIYRVPNEFYPWEHVFQVSQPSCRSVRGTTHRCRDVADYSRTLSLPSAPLSIEYLLLSWLFPSWCPVLWMINSYGDECNQLTFETTMRDMFPCLDLIMVFMECHFYVQWCLTHSWKW